MYMFVFICVYVRSLIVQLHLYENLLPSFSSSHFFHKVAVQ